jgi:serine protease AprX
MKRVLTALAVGIFLASSLYAQNSKLDQSLNGKVAAFKQQKSAGSNSGKTVDLGKEKVRVILKTIPSLKAAAEAEATKHGGKLLKKFKILSGSVAELEVEEVEALSKHLGVKGISLDAPIRSSQLSLSSLLQASHLRVTTGATTGLLSYGSIGWGVGIAIVDSGIANVPDLANVVKSVNFTGDGRAPRSDPFGHGTHVAGLAAGMGVKAGGRFRGVAPGASLIDLRVLNAQGAGYTSDVIAAIEWAISNRNAIGDNGRPMNIRVINLSLGHPPSESAETDPLAAACREAVRQGMVVVAAAGNYGKDDNGVSVAGGITSPGTENAVITVGAMSTWATDVRTDDSVATYSSRGPTYLDRHAKPDIVAPGSGMVGPKSPGSKLITENPALAVETDYLKLSGTSMAAPAVSGAVALILQKKPDLNPNAVKAILMYTAEKRNAPAAAVGAGYLNIAGALNLATNINTSASNGSYWLLNNGLGLSYSNVLAGSPVVWGKTIVWDDTLYSGTYLNFNKDAWGLTIVWSETIVWSDTIVWSETIVWSDTIVWGDTIVWTDTIVWGEAADTNDTPETILYGVSPETEPEYPAVP